MPTSTVSRSEAALVMAQAAAAGTGYPSTLGHTPDFDELWANITAEVDEIRAAGQVVDIPFDQSLMPDEGALTAGAFPVRHSPATGRYLPAGGAESGPSRAKQRAEKAGAGAAPDPASWTGDPDALKQVSEAAAVAASKVRKVFPGVDLTLKVAGIGAMPSPAAMALYEPSDQEVTLSDEFKTTAGIDEFFRGDGSRYVADPDFPFHPVNTNSVAGLLAHEFGHAVVYQLSPDMHGNSYGLRTNVLKGAIDSANTVMHGFEWQQKFASYGINHPDEFMADAIAHVALGGRNRGAREMVRYLRDAAPWKAEPTPFKPKGLAESFPVRHSPATGRFLPTSGIESTGPSRSSIRAARKAKKLAPEVATKHYAEWEHSLSLDEKGALGDYTDPGFASELNGHLRRAEHMTPDQLAAASLVDKALDEAPELPFDTKVVRGVYNGFAQDILGMKLGQTFKEQGFTSTDLVDVPPVAKGEKQVHLIIDVPPGTRAGYVYGLSQHADEEQELVIGSGTTYRILEKHPAGADGIPEVVLGIVHQDPPIVFDNPFQGRPPATVVGAAGAPGGYDDRFYWSNPDDVIWNPPEPAEVTP